MGTRAMGHSWMRPQLWLWTVIPASAFSATPKEKERKEKTIRQDLNEISLISATASCRQRGLASKCGPVSVQSMWLNSDVVCVLSTAGHEPTSNSKPRSTLERHATSCAIAFTELQNSIKYHEPALHTGWYSFYCPSEGRRLRRPNCPVLNNWFH